MAAIKGNKMEGFSVKKEKRKSLKSLLKISFGKIKIVDRGNNKKCFALRTEVAVK